MARQLILHIGTMKTGSTSIQRVLGANRPAMLAQGAYYPATPNDNNHMLLAMIFTSSPEAYHGYGNVLWRGREPLEYLGETQDRFVAEMKALPAGVDRVIVSSEQFSQLVRKPDDIARVKALMAPFFDSYKVVVYLRRQDSHVASNHSQTLRRGVVRKPGFQRGRDGAGIYDYAALIESWAAAFGEDAMCPRIFERGDGVKFDVVADFNALCGLQGLMPPAAAEASNPSMNAAGQRILRQIGLMLKEKQGGDFARTALWKRLTAAVTEALPGRGWQPTQAEAQAFVAQFADANETVRKRWFSQRASLFSADYSDLPVVQPEIDRKQEAHATYTVLLHVMQETLDREQETEKRRVQSPKKNAEKSGRRAALIRTIRRDPNDADAHVQLASLQIEDGALKAARYNIEKALKIAPDHARGLKLLEKV